VGPACLIRQSSSLNRRVARFKFGDHRGGLGREHVQAPLRVVMDRRHDRDAAGHGHREAMPRREQLMDEIVGRCSTVVRPSIDVRVGSASRFIVPPRLF
jgi:hypothetical protein